MTKQELVPHGRKRSRVNAPVRKYRAILIGLAADLPAVSASISRIHVALRDHGIFETHAISLFFDHTLNGNRERIQHQLSEIAKESREHPLERVLFLFVGHGMKMASGYRLLCPDRSADAEHPITPDNALEEDWLVWETFQNWLLEIHSHDLLLLMDTCESGSLISKTTHKWLQEGGTRYDGHWILVTGSSGSQKTWERGGICFFTESLAEGLEGWGGRNDRGAVDVEYLFRYLQQRVRARAFEAGVQQFPNRLIGPSALKVSMELTHPDSRVALDDLLYNAIQDERCLLWVGERLAERGAKGSFPERLAWPGENRGQWIAFQDQLFTPGPSSRALAQLQMPLLDTGFDTLVERALFELWGTLQVWSTEPGGHSESPVHPMLLRPTGTPGFEDFCFATHQLNERFYHILTWLAEARQPWDTLLVMGLAPEDPLTEQWLALLAARFAPRIWLVFPYGENHELVSQYRALKIRLIFANDKDFLRALSKLRKGRKIDKANAKLLPLPPQQPWKDVRGTYRPYPGLVPFDDSSYHQFFGRSGPKGQGGDLQRLREDMHHHRKVILYGDSGNGKTSLLRAGLLYVLRELDGFLTFYTDTEEPLEQLCAQLQNEPYILEALKPEEALERAAFVGHQSGCPVVICIDQIERAFLREFPEDESAQTAPFWALFAQAVERLEKAWPLGEWVLLLSIRKDQLALLQQFQKEWHYRLGQEVQLRELKPLSYDMARQAMTAPLPPTMSFDETLLQRLLEEIHTGRNPVKMQAGQEIWFHPALLQLVCAELYTLAKESGDHQITQEHYERTDGLEGLLQKLYQRTIAQLTASQIRAVQSIFVQLTSRHGIRKRRRWRELSQQLEKKGIAIADGESAREILTIHRIIRQVGHGGQHFVELSHDLLTSLAQPFTQQEDRLLDRILDEWEAIRAKEDPQSIFSIDLLQSMKASVGWLERLPEAWQADARACYERSWKSFRIRRGIWIALTCLLFMVLGGGLWMGWKARQARLFDQKQLAKVEQEAQQLKIKQGVTARKRLAEILVKNAHNALLQKKFFESYTQLFRSMSLQDSSLGRFLWWQLRHQPLYWSHATPSMYYDVVFSPKGREVLIGGVSGVLSVMDPNTRKKRQIARLGDQILSTAYSPDGRFLAAGGRDGKILLYQRLTKRQFWLQSKLPIWSLVFSPDSQTLAVGEYGGKVRFWDLRRIGTFKVGQACYPSVAWGLSYHPNGKMLISAHGQKHLCVWDTQRRKVIRKLGPHAPGTYGVQFSRDGEYIYTADNKHLWSWHLKSGKAQKVAHGHIKRIHSVSRHPKLPIIATASWDHTLRIWDARNLRMLHALQAQSRVFKAAFHPKRPWMMSLEIVGKALQYWDLSTSTLKGKHSAHTGFSYDVAFHPKQPWLASVGLDRKIRLWDRRTGQIIRIFRGHKAGVTELKFHPGGKWLASSSKDRTVRLWDVRTGLTTKVLTDQRILFRTLTFHTTKPWLAATGNHSPIVIWNWQTGARVKELMPPKGESSSLAFHPSKSWLISNKTEDIHLWDVETGKLLQTFQGHKKSISSIGWSRDGSFIYSGGEDGTIYRWSPETGKGKRQIQLPSRIYDVDLHPSKLHFLAACERGTLHIWKEGQKTSKVIQAYPRSTGSSVFSPDGGMFATSGNDGSIRLWDAVTHLPIWKSPLLQKKPLRLMTHLGWQTFPFHRKLQRTTVAALSQKWRRIFDRTQYAQLSPKQRMLCLYSHRGKLEAWQREPLQRVWQRKVPFFQKLESLETGCLVLGDKGFQHISWKNKVSTIHDNVSTFSVQNGQISFLTQNAFIIQLQKDVPLHLDLYPKLKKWSQLKIYVPKIYISKVTALAQEGDKWVIGYHSGQIEVLWTANSTVTRRFSLTRAFHSPVTHIIHGPKDTILVGFLYGSVTHRSTTTGELLYSGQLNGPISHLLYTHEHLIAATTFADSLIQDLSIYSKGYCELWKEMRTVLPLRDPKVASKEGILQNQFCLKSRKK